MTESQGATGGRLTLPPHEEGRDPLWDRLGDTWQAVDGAHEKARVYVEWGEDDAGRRHLMGLLVHGAPITAELLRSLPVGRIDNAGNATPVDAEQFRRELVPLRRRQGEDADEFTSRVAFYYRFFAAMSSKPAKEMAEHAGAPVSTVHGWIREARMRGKLPPGKKGKAG